MSYPFAGFGTFLFKREEYPIFGTDTGWSRDPSYSQVRPLGSNTDSIVTLAVGSATRSYEVLLSPDRFAALEALVNTAASHVDWERPTPDSRNAFLAKLTPVDPYVVATCQDGLKRRRIRTLLELVSQ